MDKYEKLNQVKEYITKIEEDIAVSDIDDKQTIMNKNITECLKYISGIIEELVNENMVSESQGGKRFFITEDQTYELTAKDNIKISEIADELNRVTEINNTGKITTTWITDWLVSMDILYKNDYGNRIPTPKGNEMGIKSRMMCNKSGQEYPINYYSLTMQKYIYENIDNIISFHYDYKTKKNKEKSKNSFFITEEQRKQLQIKENAIVSEITNELNRVTAENNVKKVQATWITEWLLDVGMLQKNDENKRLATQAGNEIGITSEQNISLDGRTYMINFYSENAQKYIYDNINNIISFHNTKRNMNTFQDIPYPKNMHINKFIAENKKENIIIMSVGNCNSNREEGSYKVVLIYQNNHKVVSQIN